MGAESESGRVYVPAALTEGVTWKDAVSSEELTNLLVDLVQRSRHLVYAKQPQLFSQDIVRLMDLKRRAQ